MKIFSPAFVISFIYFLIGFAWILFSDKILFSLPISKEMLSSLQTIKGWIFILITSALLYIFIRYSLKNLTQSIEEHKNIINKVPTPIIIFNEDGKVLMINKVFKELSGYKYNEINTIEKWTKKAYGDKAPIVKEIVDSLYDINEIVDNGEYEIRKKDGTKTIWHFNSAPYGILEKKRTVIASALDITEYKDKENMIMQESKMEAMCEILENIAHQWRQPLSIISTASTGIKLKNETGTLDNIFLNDTMTKINNQAQFLSKTIDDFRGFFKPDQEKEYFQVNHTFEKVMMVLGDKFKSENIKFVKDIEYFQILNYNNALMQVFINIFNNSKDAFIEHKIEDRFIFVDIYSNDYNITIQIKDNAGGISGKIIHKIFEPYFTTKHQSKGTGLGLYMSEEIITKHMQGDIKVENKKFTHNDKKYSGAMFTINLPLKI